MLARRELVEKVGLLDDRFFIYSEELDWCLRARMAGYRLAVVKESVIWHKGHRDAGRIGRPFVAYLQARNHLLMLRNNSGYFLAGGIFALIYFACSALFQVGRGIAGWAGTGDRGCRDYAWAVAVGIADYWRGRFGRPGRRLS